MMDAVKNRINNAVMTATKQLVAPPKESSFLEKGLLTPEEYVQSGDKLISMCESWKWYSAVDPKYQSQYLPEKKQFIGIEGIRCRLRVKELLNDQNVQIIDGDDDEFVITSKKEQVVVEGESIIQQSQQAEDVRSYDLYIIYDLYYFTPRLFLAGRDELGNLLSYDQIKEYKKDIMGEYADKTVTNEYHPHLNIYLPTVHPCKHADTLKFLTQQMIEGGADKSRIHADNSILIFLKFMGSVIPTIEFDFVSEIVIG